jgi:hypothetical protein
MNYKTLRVAALATLALFALEVACTPAQANPIKVYAAVKTNKNKKINWDLTAPGGPGAFSYIVEVEVGPLQADGAQKAATGSGKSSFLDVVVAPGGDSITSKTVPHSDTLTGTSGTVSRGSGSITGSGTLDGTGKIDTLTGKGQIEAEVILGTGQNPSGVADTAITDPPEPFYPYFEVPAASILGYELEFEELTIEFDDTSDATVSAEIHLNDRIADIEGQPQAPSNFLGDLYALDIVATGISLGIPTLSVDFNSYGRLGIADDAAVAANIESALLSGFDINGILHIPLNPGETFSVFDTSLTIPDIAGAPVTFQIISQDEVGVAAAVPEPSSFFLFGMGLVGLGYLRNKRAFRYCL